MGDKWKDMHKLSSPSWQETAMDEGLLFMEVIQQLVQDDSIANAGLKAGAKSILAVLPIIQAFENSEEVLERLAGDALGLIVAIWRLHDQAIDPKHWPPYSIKETIHELAGILQILYSVVKRRAGKSHIKRTIFSISDLGNIKYCRRRMDAAITKLEAEPDTDINSLLLEVVHEQEHWYCHQTLSGKKEHIADAAKREAERMLEEARRKHAEDEWRNFTILMHAR